MKAIQVKYIPASKFQPARLKAFTEGNNSITVPFEHGISNDEIRIKIVAKLLIEKMKWNVKISGFGQLPNGGWCVTMDSI